ncbi:PepSY-associated TM helix domain-containing protein [Galbibacter sp.]|uniref:PepSY-associated TM helix domain-containing protein n=1 Tax=Galbibacter sp. TaxID=2918471 RepID=UPI003A8DFADF
MKHKKLHKWIWKWHFLSGIIALPFILLLSLTGIIYLFKDTYEQKEIQHYREVVVTSSPLPFQRQWEIAKNQTNEHLTSMIIPSAANHATVFESGKFGTHQSLFVDPYKGMVTGLVIDRNTDMYNVRKLHGELLMGSFGTKIIELIGSWMVVLIITGLYVWWPENSWKLKSYFLPRIRSGRRTFFRDTHAITGFWLSTLFLMILAGGLPWTDVFGSGFKWVQEKTHTGYPTTWHNYSQSDFTKNTEMVPLDFIVEKAQELQLPGAVSITFPKDKKGVFSVQNIYYKDLNQQKKYHLNPYSGELIKQHEWADVGVLMRGRMWLMAFHQGQFGQWNWILVLLTAFLLFMMSLSAIISYVLRKRKNNWGVPKVPKNYSLGIGMLFIIGFLCVLLPLFGLSVIIIVIFEQLKNNYKSVTLI